jgi:hypothetical protein
MKKQVTRLMKYAAFWLLAIGAYILFYVNGFNLLTEYPKEIGGAFLYLFFKLGSKWFGWNLKWLLKDSVAQKAGESIINTQEWAIRTGAAAGEKIVGKIKRRRAKTRLARVGNMSSLKAGIILSMVYPSVRKEMAQLWKENDGKK